MNLTSKRMLQFVMMCAGVCVMSATAATQYIADSFENDPADHVPATNGLPIVYYKAQTNEVFQIITTNWLTAAGDASKIVTADAGNQEFDGTRPLGGAASNLVLNLETEGQTLTRPLPTAQPFTETSPVYVDTLIKFTPSEDTPVISDPSVKAAVYVDNDGKLCVYHGVGFQGASPQFTTTTVPINTNDWYRLTIVMTTMPGSEDTELVYQIYLDNTVITNAAAMDEAYNPGGSYFWSASTQNQLNAVAFQGTGLIDELVIADDVPGIGQTTILLTLDFDPSQVVVTVGGTPVADNGTVAADSQIVIDANDWYEIASVTGTGDAAYTGLPVPGALVNVSTGTVTATAAATITISSAAYSSSTAISTGLGGTQPADKVAAWAIANDLDEGDLTGAMLDDYLCNLAPGTNPVLEIKSIVIDQDTGWATIVVGSTANAVDFDSINGTLVVYTSDDLADALAEPAGTEYEVTVQQDQTATIEVLMAGNNFIRAVVK